MAFGSTARMKPLCFCFSAFLLLCFLLPASVRAGNLTTDAEALLAFKEDTGNKDNKNLLSWNAENMSTVCTTWAGVACSNDSASQRVVALYLPDSSLSGQIPPTVLGKLEALRNLSLGSNQFYGEFPSDLANCTSLRGLYLQNNSFSGPLSASAFTAWPSLMQVDLSFNNFNGSIPNSITNASLLQSLNLQNNSFSGSIPAITTSQLQSFNVANNELNGSIPASLSRFSAQSFAGNEGLCGNPLQTTCTRADSVETSPSTTTTSNGSPSKKATGLSAGAIAGIVSGSVVGGLLLLFAFLARRKSNRSPSARVVDNIESGSGDDSRGGTSREAQVEQQPIAIGENKLVFVEESNKGAFDIEGLLGASAEVMGKGTLGVAFKAILENNLEVIVKRLNFEYKRDYKERLKVLGKLRHPNLVPIKAWYFYKSEKLLVYDYFDGSLYNHLHHDEEPMAWEKRLEVARTVANVLTYLHEKNVVHGNIKASNVLMNADGEAYVTDYGLVPLAVKLTVKNDGYKPPEVGDLCRMTAQGDVYSFGVLLLELLTGRSPTAGGGRNNGDVVDLPRWVQSVVSEQWTAEVFDLDIMKFEYIQEEMILLLQTALLCVSPSPDRRPPMRTVATSIHDLTSSDDEGSLASPIHVALGEGSHAGTKKQQTRIS